MVDHLGIGCWNYNLCKHDYVNTLSLWPFASSMCLSFWVYVSDHHPVMYLNEFGCGCTILLLIVAHIHLVVY